MKKQALGGKQVWWFVRTQRHMKCLEKHAFALPALKQASRVRTPGGARLSQAAPAASSEEGEDNWGGREAAQDAEEMQK